MVQPFRPQVTTPRTLFQYDITQQTTLAHPLVSDENAQDTIQDVASLSHSLPIEEDESETNFPTPSLFSTQIMALFKKTYTSRVIAVGMVIAIVICLYLLWRPSSSSNSTVQPADTATTIATVSTTAIVSTQNTTTTDTGASGTTIQVYIVGAVLHPGVYTVDSQARVYQLVQKAGGPISTADLASLNLAARLSDGQEVDVLRVGETPVAGTSVSSTAGTSSTATVITTPDTQAQVNINTASADELKQQLSVSSKTAQTIISYRLQHGPFTSVDTLAQVVSQSIYKKIKDKVTVQ